jgi:hypothetical protein
MRAARTLSAFGISTHLARAVLGVALASFAMLACERKAPGPSECADYAEAFVRDALYDEPLTPEIQSKIDAVTQLCLTTPYDRDLIACAQSTKRARACFDLYKQRTRQGAQP